MTKATAGIFCDNYPTPDTPTSYSVPTARHPFNPNKPTTQMLFLRNIPCSGDTFPACHPDEGGICYGAIIKNKLNFLCVLGSIPKRIKFEP